MRIISEGSCDTEDWSNDTENSTLPQLIVNYIINNVHRNYIIKYISIKNSYFKLL